MRNKREFAVEYDSEKLHLLDNFLMKHDDSLYTCKISDLSPMQHVTYSSVHLFSVDLLYAVDLYRVYSVSFVIA